MYHLKEDRRSTLSKNMLYRALSEIMREKDFPSITIKEVVQGAQVARATFYRNFDRLEDILQWKCDETFDDLYRTIIRSISSPSAQPVPGKYPFILPFFRYWHADSEIIELLIAANRIDIIFTAFEHAMRKLIAHFRPALPALLPHFEYFLAFRSGAVIRVLLMWIRNRKDLSPEEMYRLIEAQAEGIRPE